MSWRILKALDELNRTGETKANIQEDDFVKTVLIGYERVVPNKSKLIATQKFKTYYEKNHLSIFQQCSGFLEENNLQMLSQNFSLNDIQNLIRLKNNKHEILSGELTFKQISSRYFPHSKYLVGKKNLIESVKFLLGDYKFPEDNKEQQHLSVLHSINQPAKIILCENDDRLFNPRQPETEFWYAGGKNTAKLKYVPVPDIPVFYLCDWDYDGLTTYLHIRENYYRKLQIIIPSNYKELFKSIEETNHDSKWKDRKILEEFENPAKKIISELMEKNCWVEEESIKIERTFIS